MVEKQATRTWNTYLVYARVGIYLILSLENLKVQDGIQTRDVALKLGFA